MIRHYFGTDGVRGPYGGPVINENFAARLGCAVARWALTRRPASAGDNRVLIGRDTRASGEPLLRALAAGLSAGGLQPVSLGVLPTPAVARQVKTRGSTLGVVITASHNPATDNGIKFFTTGGAKLIDEDEAAIESLLPPPPPPPPSGELRLDETATAIDARNDYCASLINNHQNLLPREALRGWHIVLDTANGATHQTSPDVLRATGATLAHLGNAPDGHNINAGVGSEHPALLSQTVQETKARLGIAHDGDGDRCVLCDETGSILDGDELLAILGTHALARGRLASNTLVTTVQSNLGLDAAIRAAGGRTVRTPVGDRYVLEHMRATGSNLGGESSGHIVCADIGPTGDGLVAALSVIRVMLETGKPLSELRRVLKKYPQATRNLRVRERRPLDELPALQAAIAAIETRFAGRGRVLVRFSGTEAKLRLLVEAETDAETRQGLDELEAAARAGLDVL
ncbi:phosphoglucosamine mutase [Opitutaceae bacterium TAV4]|nr:phosphoglucosamine mutase [Opitutaceae bacterium TAV4]